MHEYLFNRCTDIRIRSSHHGHARMNTDRVKKIHHHGAVEQSLNQPDITLVFCTCVIYEYLPRGRED
jgi:hypothetical protein